MLKHARFRVGLGPREDKYDKNVLCEGFFFFPLVSLSEEMFI